LNKLITIKNLLHIKKLGPKSGPPVKLMNFRVDFSLKFFREIFEKNSFLRSWTSWSCWNRLCRLNPCHRADSWTLS